MTTPTLFGTGGHDSGGQRYLSTTYYSNIGLGRCAMMSGGFTNESYVSQIIRVPGKFSYLSWGLDTAFGATLTLALNKNSSATALTVSIGAFTTGWVTDSSDSVSVSDGDALDFGVSIGTGTISSYGGSFFCTSARFDANTGSAQLLTAVGANFIYPTTTTQFLEIFGTVGFLESTESNQQFQCLAEGIWKNMACYLEYNGFGENTTVASRKNSSNGLMAVSIRANTSGYYEDVSSTGSDSVSVGDLLDYGFTASAPDIGEYFELVWIGAHFLATNTALCMIGGSAGPGSDTLDQRYSSLFGGGYLSTTEPRATGLFPYALNATDYTNYLPGPQDGAATFTLLINGLASALTVSSGGKSGYLTDSSDVVSVAVGDTCANSIALSYGAVTWAYASLLLDSA